EVGSYHMALHHALLGLRDRHRLDMGDAANAPHADQTGYHVLLKQDISDDEQRTLHQLARLHLHADGRPLLRHIADWSAWHEAALDARAETSVTAVPVLPTPPTAPSPTHGQFTSDEGAFTFDVGQHKR